MFYFDKQNPNVLFCDIREVDDMTLCDGRSFTVHPDRIIDVSNMPFDDGTFPLVVFDPPHLSAAGESGWQSQKYGVLPADWKNWLALAFSECWRVLAPNGTLIFKWYEYRIKLAELYECFPCEPLLGNRRPVNSKTHWLVFFKEDQKG